MMLKNLFNGLYVALVFSQLTSQNAIASNGSELVTGWPQAATTPDWNAFHPENLQAAADQLPPNDLQHVNDSDLDQTPAKKRKYDLSLGVSRAPAPDNNKNPYRMVRANAIDISRKTVDITNLSDSDKYSAPITQDTTNGMQRNLFPQPSHPYPKYMERHLVPLDSLDSPDAMSGAKIEDPQPEIRGTALKGNTVVCPPSQCSANSHTESVLDEVDKILAEAKAQGSRVTDQIRYALEEEESRYSLLEYQLHAILAKELERSARVTRQLDQALKEEQARNTILSERLHAVCKELKDARSDRSKEGQSAPKDKFFITRAQNQHINCFERHDSNSSSKSCGSDSDTKTEPTTPNRYKSEMQAMQHYTY